MKKIIVSVSNNLITDQRVEKVCNSLHNNGFEILLIGRDYPKNIKNQLNRPYKTKRIKLIFNKGGLFFAEYNLRLFFILLFNKKNILLSNDLDTLLPNFLVSKLQNKKIIFDSHELFSEIPELVNRQRVKKIWLGLEQLIIPKLKNCYTVCESIANHYKENYGTEFSVVRNLPVLKSDLIVSKKIDTSKKIIIYQGAVNIGRGLELMIETMSFLEEYLFLIVGSGDIIADLQESVTSKRLSEKIQFYGKITPNQLKEITPNAVLGISLEEDMGLNYRYALPNKIFDYIQAEVPVLTSNLPEMKQIVKNYNVGEIVYNRKPKLIADQIKAMTQKKFCKALITAKKELIWKTDEEKLLALFRE